MITKEEVKQERPVDRKVVQQAQKVYQQYKTTKQPTKSSDGFETVGRRRTHSDSSDDEEVLPVMLGIKIEE